MNFAILGSNDVDEGSPKTLAEAIYRKLRADIVWGKLVPGAPLRSDDLRSRYGVGVSPLREALSRLVSERLVTQSGQRGFRVAPLRAETVIDVVETRLVIESAALRRSIEIGDVGWETTIVAAHHTMSRMLFPKTPGQDAEIWTTHHKAFHMALISACGSKWQIHLADLLFDQAERFRMLPKTRNSTTNKRRNPAKEHQLIVEAALDRDAARSIDALALHYRGTMRSALEALENWQAIADD